MAATPQALGHSSPGEVGHIGQIPIRNLWLLMLYASDLYRELGHGKTGIEDLADEIPDVVAEVLVHAVEQRLRRNLTFGYRHREAVLGRVRGRIDLLNTERHRLLERGSVACRFEELTVNTPRNCFVRAALDAVARVASREGLAHRCRSLAARLKRVGVTGERPNRADMAVGQFGRHDKGDLLMVSAARLAFDMALPTEEAGRRSLPLPDRDEVWVRKLYEKAVGGFYGVVLSPNGWRTHTGRFIKWPHQQKTEGIDAILPSMQTDIILDHPESGRRIVIDTKFTAILKPGWYRKKTLTSGYIYQVDAYLRSQEGTGDPLADHAVGLLLHPAVGEMIDETVVIQGHAIRFATVDMAAPTTDIRNQLLRVISPAAGLAS
jgi:5-methylcytosine-specific restriction enzyme subunit McrC